MRVRTVKIKDVSAHFEHWNFPINPYHYSALGVVLREYKIKKPKAPVTAPTEEIKEAVTYTCYATAIPPYYDFQVGDIFYRGGIASDQFIQVAAKTPDKDIEAHTGMVGVRGSRTGYIITPGELAGWLETGGIPANATAINKSRSRAGILAWELSS